MLRGTAAIAGALTLRASGAAVQSRSPQPEPIYLRVHAINVELAPRVMVAALGCNGYFTGAVMRLNPSDGSRIHVTNDVDRIIDIDGSGIPAGARLGAGERVFADVNSLNSRFVCPQIFSQGASFDSLRGLVGMFVRQESTQAVDQAHFLTVHHWLPSPAPEAGSLLATEIAYRYATLGDRLLTASEPIRVREGQRVGFHFFNASPTKTVSLSLPRHRFLVLALDGHPVARPGEVNHLALGPGERVETIVHMTNPGRFVLGSTDRRDRGTGFGRIVEYANAHGALSHPAIEPTVWDYTWFGGEGTVIGSDVTQISLTLKHGYESEESRVDFHRLQVDSGRRYRLSIVNATGERHPVALRGHPFELTSIAGNPVRGIVKDTIALPTFCRTDIEFLAANTHVDLLHAPNVSVES